MSDTLGRASRGTREGRDKILVVGRNEKEEERKRNINAVVNFF